MNRLGAILIVTALTAPLSAAPTDLSDRLVKPTSIGFKHAVYNTATGRLDPVGIRGGNARIGEKFWTCFQTSGFFMGLGNCFHGEADELFMDWMDIPAGSQVGGIRVGYGTDASHDPNAIRLTILFQNDANGFNNNTGPFVAGFRFDLPGRPLHFPYQFVGWIITIDLDAGGASFTYGDADLDGDGLADTGYYYGALGPRGYGDGTAAGPLFCEPNDPLLATGVEDAFDLYVRDPNHPCEDPNAPFDYDGTYWFGGLFYAQLGLALFRSAPGCPSPGCEAGDLDADCIVGLADLSDLLEHFGCALADPCYDADADIDGDGVVGLSDLSALLDEFGADCSDTGQVTGACCFASGNCSVLRRFECERIWGTEYQGDGTTCDPNPCMPPPLGACCFEDGSCVELSRTECQFVLGGNWQGPGSTCTPNACPQPGACCFLDGTCTVASYDECEFVLHGDYQGHGTACEPSPCAPRGACCLAAGSCVVTSELDCETRRAGVYVGDDTTCESSACPIPGACCLPDGSCVVLPHWECEWVRGGVFQGAATVCDLNPCPIP